jgi:Tfp pilus assembly protein PilZ
MAGTNRRRSDRVPKRVEVQFWQMGEKIRRGYSTNISARGMHITTANPLPPRSRLRIEVFDGQRGFLVEGVVAHRRLVAPELMKVTPPGMGVRFLSPDELVHELLPPEGAAGTRTFSVHFATAREFLDVYERDIANGGLFVATSQPCRLREQVRIALHPPGPSPTPLLLPARVVQRFEPGPGGGAVLEGMGVELLDLSETLARLRPIVESLAGLIS